MGRVLRTFYIFTSSVGGAELDELAAGVAPRLSAHNDAFRLDPRLLARYEAIIASGEEIDAEGA